MNILASLVRVIFSIIVLLAIACYLQATPSVSLGDFCLFIEPAQLVQMLSGFNAVTVSLVIILLLGILSFTRVLEAAWNIIFCGSILVLLAASLYFIGGPAVALPNALYHNDAVLQVCQLLSTYHVPVAIAGLIFIAGWLCASASGRVAITAVVSFGLWYGLTELFTYAIHQWAKSADPKMPEALHMVQGSPWIIAAVPGAFFLIYALLMAFFETFITKAPKATQAKPKDEQKDDKKDTEKAAAAAEKTVDRKPNADADKKPAEPVAKSKPILKAAAPAPQKKLKLATAASAPVTAKEESSEAKETKCEKVTTQAEEAETIEPAAAKPDDKEETKEPAALKPEEKKETETSAKDSEKEDKALVPANESEPKEKASAPATEDKTVESLKKEEEPKPEVATKE